MNFIEGLINICICYEIDIDAGMAINVKSALKEYLVVMPLSSGGIMFSGRLFVRDSH